MIIMPEDRRYNKISSIVFRKTSEPFGGLSNMAPGYPIFWNIIIVKSSEALYQALKFPDHIDIQRSILMQHSPMVAKWISRKNNIYARRDWELIKFRVMRLCIELKLINNWIEFGELLDSTGSRDIVEYTPERKVWGACDKGWYYEGPNALGRLLMALREDFIIQQPPHNVHVPSIPDLSIMGIDVSEINLIVPRKPNGLFI